MYRAHYKVLDKKYHQRTSEELLLELAMAENIQEINEAFERKQRAGAKWRRKIYNYNSKIVEEMDKNIEN